MHLKYCVKCQYNVCINNKNTDNNGSLAQFNFIEVSTKLENVKLIVQ